MTNVYQSRRIQFVLLDEKEMMVASGETVEEMIGTYCQMCASTILRDEDFSRWLNILISDGYSIHSAHSIVLTHAAPIVDYPHKVTREKLDARGMRDLLVRLGNKAEKVAIK